MVDISDRRVMTKLTVKVVETAPKNLEETRRAIMVADESHTKLF